MRKWLAIALVVMILPALAAQGQSELEYRDDFGEVSYSGSDGNLDWSDPWVEAGENDGPGEGEVHIGAENCANNKCLHVENAGLVALSRSASRKADLSNFATARLTYEIDVKPGFLSTGVLSVDVKGNGSGWSSLATYVLSDIAGAHSKSHDVSAFIGSDFELRYQLTGVVGGDAIAIDRVVVAGEASVATTSSSSSTSSTSTSTTSTTTPGNTTTSSAPTDPDQEPNNATTSTSATGGASASTGTTVTGATQLEGDVTTTTTASSGAASSTDGSGPIPPPETGLRESGELLIADFDPGLFATGDVSGIEVLGATVDANFSLAVEVFEQIKIWFAVLALLIAVAVVSGGEQRRRQKIIETTQVANPLS